MNQKGLGITPVYMGKTAPDGGSGDNPGNNPHAYGEDKNLESKKIKH